MHFDYNNVRRKKDNFDSVLKSIKKVLNMWKWRGLTLIGRIQIVKSFAIPKIMSKASLIPVSSELIKEVNKELYSFIWKGKDKVKRSALINDIEDGGLKMLDLESKGAFLWVIRVRISDPRSVWIMVHQRNRRVRSFEVIRVRISDPRSVWIMVHQRNRRIRDQSGFAGSFDAP